MAGTRIETEFAALGADGVVRAFEAHDAALVKSTEAARKQSAVQGRQAKLLRELRDAEREEQQQLKQAAGIIDRTATAEERYDKELTERRNHLAAGRITQDQYNRSVAESRTRLLGANDAGNTLTKTLGKMALALGGVAIAARAIRAVGEINRQLSQSVDEVSERVGNAKTRLQIQAGLTDSQSDQQLKTIGATLKNTPATGLEGAIAIQQQAASVGFSEGDIQSGRALDVFLKLQAATGQVGPNADTSKSLVALKSAGSVLASSGDKLTSGNLERLAIKFANLFATTPVESTDLPALGEVTAPLKSYQIGEDERLGAFATAATLLGGQKGATALKQTAGFLAASSAKSKELQKQFGLDTSQFDVNGEGLAESIENITAQMAPLSEEQKRLAVFKIFGKEAGANFLTLQANVGSIRTNTALAAGGRAAFDERVGIFNRSELAGRQGIAIDTELATLGIDEQRGSLSYAEIRERQELLKRRLMERANDPLSRTTVAAMSAFQSASVSALEFVGAEPATAARQALVSDEQTGFFRNRAGLTAVAPGAALNSIGEGVTAEVVNLLSQLLATQQATHEVVAAGSREPAAAQPFVPESVSNIEPSRVSALSAEGAGR